MKRRRAASREQQLGLVFKLRSVSSATVGTTHVSTTARANRLLSMASITCVALMGCASTGQRLPTAPDANAPMLERIRYYNQYRAISMVHTHPSREPIEAPLPTLNLGTSVLANGQEVHSLQMLEPAVPSEPEFARCIQAADSAARAGTTASVIFSLLLVGGGALIGAGISTNSVGSLAGGITAAGVSVIGLPVSLFLGWGFSSLRTQRAMLLYDPALRSQLGLPQARSTNMEAIDPCP